MCICMGIYTHHMLVKYHWAGFSEPSFIAYSNKSGLPRNGKYKSAEVPSPDVKTMLPESAKITVFGV